MFDRIRNQESDYNGYYFMLISMTMQKIIILDTLKRVNPARWLTNVGATRGRLYSCCTFTIQWTIQPGVLPSVPYRHMRRWQRRGVKLSGQSTLISLERSRKRKWMRRLPAVRWSRGQGSMVWLTYVNRRKRSSVRTSGNGYLAPKAKTLGPKGMWTGIGSQHWPIADVVPPA